MKPPSRLAPVRGPKVWLVDPSLFTGPYDAALTEGLVDAGVQPMWATRPTRQGDRQEIPKHFVDDFFYRWVDDALALPGPLRAVAKGMAHTWGLLRLLWRVWRQKPDVVHFQWVVLPLLDVMAIVLMKRWCRVVMTAHDTIPVNGVRLTAMQRLGFDAPLKVSDAVIVHTQAGVQRLIDRGIQAERIVVIPHGPLRLYEQPSPSRPARDPRWTFLLFGELKPYKGLDLLVEALGQMPAAVRGKCRLIVAGRERTDVSPIRARIAELGLEDTITLRLQRQSEQEMADLFADSDCFVLPYRHIDASGVYFLVKSLRKWIIATRIGVFKEDLRDGVDGQLIDPESVAQLAQAMQSSIEQRRQPDPASGDNSWRGIGDATRALYERLSR